GTTSPPTAGAAAALPSVVGRRRAASGLDLRPGGANHDRQTSAVFEMGRIFLSDRCRPAWEPKFVPALASPPLPSAARSGIRNPGVRHPRYRRVHKNRPPPHLRRALFFAAAPLRRSL